MRKKIGIIAVLVAGALLVAACGSSSTSSKPSTAGAVNVKSFKFDNVVKLTASSWFSRMGVAIGKFSKATGIPVNQTGPAQATAEGQVSILASEIPQKPTVLGVVPNDVGALEGILTQAQSQGIIVVSQEASNLVHTNFDLEAFSNAAYGKAMMDQLSTCMGGKGQYAAFVGNLTAQSHLQWVAAALAEAKAKYPGITRVGSGPFVSQEDENVAYQQTKEILAKYPHIKGIEGSAATDVPGIAKAVAEAGLAGKICIVGTSLPSLTKQYVDNGTIYKIFLWDPGLTGEATMYGAELLAEHKKIKPGTDLQVPGYTDIQPCGPPATANCWEGNAMLILSKSNIGQYNY